MQDASSRSRPPRLAVLQLRGLDHFLPDLVAGLAASRAVEPRRFTVTGPAVVAEALAWADDPARDALWFEFCWPPFPEIIARTDLGGRRVIMRVHRIEAYGSNHAAAAPWHLIDDAIVVGEDMAARLLRAAPALPATTRLHVVHNGLDLARHPPAAAPDLFRIGWCGWLSLHKNPTLALEILHRLRTLDDRYTLHLSTRGGEAVAVDSFAHLARRMGIEQAIHVTEGIPPHAMPGWHARNGVLLSTSVYESFGYAIAEAAAVGCDLAVLDNTAAAEFWPEAVRFATVEEAVRLIRAARPHRWRGLVEARFGLDRQVGAVLALLADRPAPAPALAPALAPRERLVPIAHGGWRGVFPLRDPADHIQQVLLSTGAFYEAAMLEDLRTRLQPGELFVDVGANIGNHALFAAGVCGARVLAFEPSPALAEHCAATLAANGLAGALELRRAGVAEAAGTARLRPGPGGNAGQTSLDPGEGEVPLVRLDDVLDGALGSQAPAVVKVDVEGMEEAVLRGARGLLGRHRPALYVEAATEAAFAAVQALLRPLGYRAEARFNHTPTWLFLPAAPDRA